MQRFITKFGTKGVINLGKMVPIVGGVIGGTFDYAGTKIIASKAKDIFFIWKYRLDLIQTYLD